MTSPARTRRQVPLWAFNTVTAIAIALMASAVFVAVAYGSAARERDEARAALDDAVVVILDREDTIDGYAGAIDDCTDRVDAALAVGQALLDARARTSDAMSDFFTSYGLWAGDAARLFDEDLASRPDIDAAFDGLTNSPSCTVP